MFSYFPWFVDLFTIISHCFSTVILSFFRFCFFHLRHIHCSFSNVPLHVPFFFLLQSFPLSFISCFYNTFFLSFINLSFFFSYWSLCYNHFFVNYFPIHFWLSVYSSFPIPLSFLILIFPSFLPSLFYSPFFLFPFLPL